MIFKLIFFLFILISHNVFGQEIIKGKAKIIDGEIQYLLPPEYHGDRIRGFNSVLCFRNYGQDIVARLDFVGFHHPRIVQGDDPTGWGFSRGVVVASK